MGQNERLFVFLSSLICKMEANKVAESFPTYQILAFEVWWVIQGIKLRKQEFNRLEKIRQFYQHSFCLSKMQRKNEVTIVFCFFHTPKTSFFSKTLKISAPNSFFPKNDKNPLFTVLLTWNESLCERSKKIEAEDRIQKTDGDRRWRNAFGLPGAVWSLRIFEEVVDLVEEYQGWERRSSGKLTILLVFLRKRRHWAFSFVKQIRFRPGIHQPFEDSSVPFFLRNGFLSQQFCCSKKKAARCQPFLAVVRCLFHNHLRLKRSSLLNVYLNYKFEISFLTSHLFFSLFNLKSSLNLDVSISSKLMVVKRVELWNFWSKNPHPRKIKTDNFV